MDGAPLFQSASGGDEIEVYRIRYDLVGTNRRPYLTRTREAVGGLREVDHLNVGDPRDEAAHAYRQRSRLGHADIGATVRVDAYASGPRVADAGRAILGRESFLVRTVPGRDLVVVMRTAAAVDAAVLRVGGGGITGLTFPTAGVAVSVDGQRAGTFRLEPASGWDEWVLRLPGSAIRTGSTRLELSGRYASFYYWMYQ